MSREESLPKLVRRVSLWSIILVPYACCSIPHSHAGGHHTPLRPSLRPTKTYGVGATNDEATGMAFVLSLPLVRPHGWGKAVNRMHGGKKQWMACTCVWFDHRRLGCDPRLMF